MVKIRTKLLQDSNPENVLCDLFEEALLASDPMLRVPAHLPAVPENGRIVVVGAGKASAAMAKAVEDEARTQGWFDRIEGIVVTRYGHAVKCDRIEIVEAAHPIPDAAGECASRRILEFARGLDAPDTLICLVSGGGSALLTLPADGVSAEEKAEVNRALLRSGAPIDKINCVRKHISAIKGGRLAAAAQPARVVSLMISDVPHDDPSVIASGPTVADRTTSADAIAVLEGFEIETPPSILTLLGANIGETPKPGDAAFANVRNIVIATPGDMLAAVAIRAELSGMRVVSLGADLEGEARELGMEHAELARRLKRDRQDDKAIVILSGGETTVTVRGNGRGGRNAEYALGLAAGLAGQSEVYGLACDTDGIDGVEDNAGVFVTPDTLARASAVGFNVKDVLDRNDAYGLFAALDDLVITGPTRTNVNDFRAILILERR